MKRLYTGLLFAALFAIPAANANASFDAYLQIKGVNTKSFNPAVASGKMVVKFDEELFHEVTAPRDRATGLATGKRMHKPLKITKEVGPSTPLLQRALTSNESLSDLTFEFFKPAAGNKVAVYYKITLKDCLISSIAQVPNAPGTRGPEMEAITFTYQKIEWQAIEDGKTMAVDDWMKQSIGS